MSVNSKCSLKIKLCLTLINGQWLSLYTEMCVDDSDTFVKNKRYHIEEESVLSILAPSLATKTHWRPSPIAGALAATARASPCADIRVPIARELQTTTSAPSELGWTVVRAWP